MAKSSAEIELERQEIFARRAEARAKTRAALASIAEARKPWWRANQLTLLVAGGVLGLFANVVVALVNGANERNLEDSKSKNAIKAQERAAKQTADLERDKARWNLIIQAISTDDASLALANIRFLTGSKLLDDPEGLIVTAAREFAPALPSQAALSVTPTEALRPDQYLWAMRNLRIQDSESATVASRQIIEARERLTVIGEEVGAPWWAVGVIWKLELGTWNSEAIERFGVAQKRQLGVSPPFVTLQPGMTADAYLTELLRPAFRNRDSGGLVDVLVALDTVWRGAGAARSPRTTSAYLWAGTEHPIPNSGPSTFIRLGAAAIIVQLMELGAIERELVNEN